MRTVPKSIALVSAVLVGAGLVAPASAEQPFFNAGVRVGVNHTDNRDSVEDGTLVNGVPVKKESQTTWTVSPYVTLHKEIVDVLFLDAKYAPTFNRRDNCRPGQEREKWTHAATVSMLYAFNPITTLNVQDTFSWSGDRSYYYGSDESYGSRDDRLRDDYTDNKLSVSLTRKLADDGDYAKVTGRWRVKRYDEGEIAKYSDTDEWGARLDLMLVQSAVFACGGYVDWTSWDRKNHLGLDMGIDSVDVGAQVDWDLSGDGNHRAYASVGYEFVTYEAEGTDDRSSLSSRAELRLFQQRETQMIVGCRYGVDYADVYPFSSQEDLRGYLSLRQYFGADRRFSAQAMIELRTRTYELKDDLDPEAGKYGYVAALRKANGGKGSYDRDVFFVRISGDYKISDRLSVGAFYSFEDLDCDVTTSYKENVFGVNCTATLF